MEREERRERRVERSKEMGKEGRNESSTVTSKIKLIYFITVNKYPVSLKTFTVPLVHSLSLFLPVPPL